MRDQVLRSTRVVCGDEIRPADLVVNGGVILEILDYGRKKDVFDFGNLLIAPGFVDLHSDSVEKEVEPRPGATFPLQASLIELDRKLAMAGITTMFHAIAFNDESITSSRGTEMAARMIREINRLGGVNLSVDNLVHARYEITSFSSASVIASLIEEGQVHLLSVMDHTPGQGQFKTIESWKRFHLPTYDLTDSEADVIVRQKQTDQEKAYTQVRKLLEVAKKHQLVLLSHDDDSPEKIDLTSEWGIAVSEFPLSVEAAAHARRRGMHTGMGAPNVVRGKSQSGNVSARELIAHHCCDFLCSDYHPSSLLQAIWTMHREMDMDLHRSLAMVSSIPATIAGLHDRGRIAPDMLADLVIIDDHEIPRVVTTLKDGELAYSSLRCPCT